MIVVLLSASGIPASFVIIATVCIVGLGWGRSTREVSIADAVRGNATTRPTVDALTDDPGAPTVGDPQLDVETPPPSNRAARSELFDPETTVRVIVMQNAVPVLATVGSFLTVTVLGPV